MIWKSIWRVALLSWVALFLVSFLSLSESKAVDKPTKATKSSFSFKIIERKDLVKSRRHKNTYKRQCCHVGKRAARSGYSCYIKRNIGEIRRNMPMRFKMKYDVHGDKYDYALVRQMSFCSKTQKLTRKFNHCCDKTAKLMDSRFF